MIECIINDLLANAELVSTKPIELEGFYAASLYDGGGYRAITLSNDSSGCYSAVYFDLGSNGSVDGYISERFSLGNSGFMNDQLSSNAPNRVDDIISRGSLIPNINREYRDLLSKFD